MRLLRHASILTLLVPSALSGCAVSDFLAQHAAIAKAQFAFDHVAVQSMDVPLVTPDAKANLVVYVKVTNPNPLTAKLDRLDYNVLLEGSQVGTGAMTDNFSVDANQSKLLALLVSIPYQGLPSPVLQALLARKATVEVSGTSHLSTPFGTLDYPVDVSQSSSF